MLLGCFFLSSRRRHTRCALVTGVQTCALPISAKLATVSKRGAPVKITILTAVLVAVIAGVAPIDAIAALANAGTLAAFTAVSVCMLVMRRRAPDAPRTFRTPLAPVVGTIAILGCIYLFFSLPTKTEVFFLCWNALGQIGRAHV